MRARRVSGSERRASFADALADAAARNSGSGCEPTSARLVAAYRQWAALLP